MGLTSLRGVLGALSKEQLVARYESGRGQGERETWQPWLRAREVKSRGQSYVEPGWIVRRPYELLSGIERAVFLAVERLGGVSDIREQFPLWPIETTEEIAESMGVPHPRVPGSSFNSLMTTDLVLTTNWSDGPLIPIYVKPSRELGDRRTQEKLDIEIEWWRRCGCRLRVVTEQELPACLTVNLLHLASCRSVTPETLGTQGLAEVEAALLAAMARCPETPANKLSHDLDRALGLDAGVALIVFWHLVAKGRLRIDLLSKFLPTQPFAFLEGGGP